jgi:uncharacterized membrane protein YdjX (TVP38/TMEM64 family)
MSAMALIAMTLAAIVLCREYLGPLMGWLAHLHGWHGPALFTLLFVIVSFPMAWGYIVLNVAAGYLYGLAWGVLLTSFGAGLGSLISFVICRRFMNGYVRRFLETYENFNKIVKVIEGKHGFRIIAMTRLTPVPFGVQNALFSVRTNTRKC